MNTAPKSDLVRVYPNGHCDSVTDALRVGFSDALVMHTDNADSAYNRWAASDTDLSYFQYAQELAAGRNPEMKLSGLTPIDRAIYARIWMHGHSSPIAEIEGTACDYEIMARLMEMREAHGGHIDPDDLNEIERDSFVFWSAQCDPDYDFAPHYYT